MANSNGRFPHLFPRLLPVPKTAVVAAQKASSAALLPRGAYGAAYEFFSPDGGSTIIDITSGNSITLAFVAYWYVAQRWRAQKIAEAPLMVVQEDQETGDEEWVSDHPLAPILDEPSEDYDMGELLERTSRYLDNTGEAIWVIDADRTGLPARLTPFRRGEFTPKSGHGRIYDTFEVQTADGPITYQAEEVCYFRDQSADGWTTGTKSRLDVAMQWLRLGERARQTIRDLLNNSIWPSAVAIPDKDWNPDPATLEMYKQDLNNYGAPGMQGRPFVQLGGGQFVQLAAKIRDLVPEEVLNRVESIVASVSGVPAIVLQYQVGLENSPWSQMAQARRMAYDDTISPAWRKIERVLTRQVLRPFDEDPTLFIRFDRTQIVSLQEDRLEQVQIATMMGRAASLNERRAIMQLEPSPDPKANDIPELSDALAMAQAALLNANNAPPDPNANDNADQTPPKKQKDATSIREQKVRAAALHVALRTEAQSVWNASVKRLLDADRAAIVDLATTFLSEPDQKLFVKSRGKDRFMSAVVGYLRSESVPRWAKTTTPLLVQAAERSTAIVAADLGINYSLLHPNVLSFSRKESGTLVQGVSGTTRQFVNDVVTGAIEEGRTVKEIAALLTDGAGFAPARAELIARTETTRAYNGGPQESLHALGKATGRKFTKTWSGALDDRERDEHVAMEGETVDIDQPFSNGRMYPDEPNCRCVALHNEEE